MKKITSVLCILIGIVVIVIGFHVGKMSETLVAETNAIQSEKSATQRVYSDVFRDTNYDIPGYSFGADFYTEVYNGIDTMVTELSDMVYANKLVLDAQYDTMENLCTALDTTNKNINNSIFNQSKTTIEIAKYIIICIGLAIISLGLTGAGNAFEIKNNKSSSGTSAKTEEIENSTEENINSENVSNVTA